jgi:hypothetical protein
MNYGTGDKPRPDVQGALKQIGTKLYDAMSSCAAEARSGGQSATEQHSFPCDEA